MLRCFYVIFAVSFFVLFLSGVPLEVVQAQDKNSDTNFRAQSLKVDEMPSVDAGRSNAFTHRLEKLENEIDTLNRAVYKGERTSSRNWRNRSKNQGSQTQSHIEVRLSQLENDMRDLTGRFESNSHSIAQIHKELGEMQRQIGELVSSGRVSAQVQKGSTEEKKKRTLFSSSKDSQSEESTAVASLQNISPLSDTSFPDADPAGSYEAAFSKLKNGDYASAQKGFSKFLAIYPNHSLSPNAKYWLGETYYVREKFTEAARQFAEAYQKYPKGPKGPDNLLKLGMSLAGMGSKKDSCVAFKQLKREYPDGPSPVLRRAEQEMNSLGC